MDLGRGFDGLAAATRSVMGADPLSGHVFVFLNRRRIEPRYVIKEHAQGPWMAYVGETRLGYVALATTPLHVFGLFSGRTLNGYPNTQYLADYVHVFDWEGRLVEVMKLDKAAVDLAVDARSYRMYTLVHDPEPAIYAYTLGGFDR